MKVTAERINVKPKFEPVKITIEIETEADLALLLTQTGCSIPSTEFDKFRGTGFYDKLKVSHSQFTNANRSYMSIVKALKSAGYNL